MTFTSRRFVSSGFATGADVDRAGDDDDRDGGSGVGGGGGGGGGRDETVARDGAGRDD
jgi:hypothetical protein